MVPDSAHLVPDHYYDYYSYEVEEKVKNFRKGLDKSEIM
jgi:hypothetical protein